MTSPAQPAARSMIDISDLTVTKGGQTICHVANAIVTHGSTVGVTGANGSGKSTLLRVLADIETGYDGKCIVDASLKDRVFVHQSPYLFNGTVLSNVEYGLKARSASRSIRHEKAALWLERFGIAHLALRSVESLSGGEKRRTALARACVLEPKLLLLDEPLADLDPEGIDCVVRSLSKLDASTILITSPSPLPVDLTQATITLKQE
jgi:tungstate transport system ATP-binding protein